MSRNWVQVLRPLGPVAAWLLGFVIAILIFSANQEPGSPPINYPECHHSTRVYYQGKKYCPGDPSLEFFRGY